MICEHCGKEITTRLVVAYSGPPGQVVRHLYHQACWHFDVAGLPESPLRYAGNWPLPNGGDIR